MYFFELFTSFLTSIFFRQILGYLDFSSTSFNFSLIFSALSPGRLSWLYVWHNHQVKGTFVFQETLRAFVPCGTNDHGIKKTHHAPLPYCRWAKWTTTFRPRGELLSEGHPVWGAESGLDHPIDFPSHHEEWPQRGDNLRRPFMVSLGHDLFCIETLSQQLGPLLSPSSHVTPEHVPVPYALTPTWINRLIRCCLIHKHLCLPFPVKLLAGRDSHILFWFLHSIALTPLRECQIYLGLSGLLQMGTYFIHLWNTSQSSRMPGA